MNKAWFRGIVANKPMHDVTKGTDTLKFKLRCKCGTIMRSVVPPEIEIGDDYEAWIPVTMYGEMAAEYWPVLYEGAYIHELFGRIAPRKYGQLCVIPSAIDTTGIDDGIDEYAPLNHVELGGRMANDGWLDEINTTVKEYRWLMAAKPDLYKTSMFDAFVRMRTYKDMADDIIANHTKGDIIKCVSGPLYTFKARSNARERADYTVITEKIEWGCELAHGKHGTA